MPEFEPNADTYLAAWFSITGKQIQALRKQTLATIKDDKDVS